MELRHVAEQEKRIARQEVLIERLRKVGLPLDDALRLLGSMQDLKDDAGSFSEAFKLIDPADAARGFDNPVRSELVKSTLRGIKRTRGVAQQEAKPLIKEDLFLVLAAMGDGLKDARDMALLLIGFAGGFRRSELVAIDRGDIEHVRQGIIVHIRRSKTDQEGEGRKIGIPFGRTRWCPVAALDEWLARSGTTEGPVFRPIDRHSKISDGRLSGEAVSLVVKERAAGAGLDPVNRPMLWLRTLLCHRRGANWNARA